MKVNYLDLTDVAWNPLDALLCHNINLLINIAEHDPDWETFSENYSILGLTPSASEDDIKKAFRKLALAKYVLTYVSNYHIITVLLPFFGLFGLDPIPGV